MPSISPDGRWVAYASNESGQFEVYVAAFPESGRKWQVSVDSGNFPRWSRDGNRLFFQSGTDLMAAEVDGSGDVFGVGAVTGLFGISTGLNGLPYDVASGGDRFITVKVGEEDRPTPFEPMTLVLNWEQDLRD